MNIKKIRDQIDTIDSEIMQLLEKRFNTCDRLLKYKIKKIKDKKREKEILNKAPSEYIRKIYQNILKNSKKYLKAKLKTKNEKNSK